MKEEPEIEESIRKRRVKMKMIDFKKETEKKGKKKQKARKENKDSK